MKIKNAPGPSKTIKFKTKPTDDSMQLIEWWKTKDKDRSASQMVTMAAYLKDNQGQRYRNAAIFARLYGNQNLYSFAGSNMRMDNTQGIPFDRPTFNLVQSATDTLVSRISQSKPMPVFLTEAGDYKQRSLGKKLNNFVQGEFYNLNMYEEAPLILRDALVEGTGVAHFFETPDNRVGMERVLLTELLVDNTEAIYGKPRRLYRMKLVDRDVLYANFGHDKKMKEKIEIASRAFPDNSKDSSKAVSDLVMVVEAWSLPSGARTKDGRHTMAISSGYLIDEEYDKKDFPFEFLHYSPRMMGFWAQGLAEQLMGTQMELNSILFTISRSIKLMGVPKVLIEAGSKVVAAHVNNEIGTQVKYQGTKPEFVVHNSNAADLYAERDKLIQYGYQQCGVSSMQAAAQKPQGLNSGEAIRSYDDISNDRFASLSKRYDNFFVGAAYKIIDLAKDIAIRDGAYSTVYPGKNGTQQIDLPKAALVEDAFVIQCFTQSSLPKDPAGRLAKVTEMIQSGMISIQEGRRLLDYPDLEQVEKLANAAEERLYQIMDEIIEDGKYTPPDPFMPLDLASQVSVQYYNLYASAKLEEEKLQHLRNFFAQVQTLKGAAQPQPIQQPALPPQAAPEPVPTSPLVPNVPNPQPMVPQ